MKRCTLNKLQKCMNYLTSQSKLKVHLFLYHHSDGELCRRRFTPYYESVRTTFFVSVAVKIHDYEIEQVVALVDMIRSRYDA